MYLDTISNTIVHNINVVEQIGVAMSYDGSLSVSAWKGDNFETLVGDNKTNGEYKGQIKMQ